MEERVFFVWQLELAVVNEGNLSGFVVFGLGRHLKEELDVYGQDHRVWKKNQQNPDGSNRFFVMQNPVQVLL